MTNIVSSSPNFRLENEQTHHLYLKDSIYSSEDSDHVPVIDLHSLNYDQLDKACKDWGVLRLVNHGIPFTLLKQLEDIAKQIFCLSYETKQASVSHPVTYFDGTPVLSPTGTTVTRNSQNFWVEGFNFPFNQLSEFQPQLPILDSFKLALEEYKKHMYRITRILMTAMARNLNMKLEILESYLSESTGHVRVYRYPPPNNSDAIDANASLGIEAHTDSSLLAILSQDDEVSGLEVLKDDQWLTVKPISNTLIVNIGDLVQAMSDDTYKSVMHRVKVNKEKERISICFFGFPDHDVMIQSSRYKPFSYNEFRAQVQQDVKTVGCKVGLERFKKNEG